MSLDVPGDPKRSELAVNLPGLNVCFPAFGPGMFLSLYVAYYLSVCQTCGLQASCGSFYTSAATTTFIVESNFYEVNDAGQVSLLDFPFFSGTLLHLPLPVSLLMEKIVF